MPDGEGVEPEVAHAAPEDEPPPEPLATVLVVDDDTAIREMLVVVLEMEGYRALPAENGHQALALLAEEEVDLVTLDVMMPGLSGWQVVDAMRADPRTRNIPRIMISGMPIDHLMKACAKRQAAAIINKPFDVPKVVQLIADLLASPATAPLARSS